MERYASALEESADGTRQQERHYQLLSALQSLVKELPRCAAAGWARRSGVGPGGRWRRPGPARAHRARLPAVLSSSACPTPRSVTWRWRFSTALCLRSCRVCWRSSTSPRRACTTSACGYRTNTEVRGGWRDGAGSSRGQLFSAVGPFPGRPSQENSQMDQTKGAASTLELFW